MLIQFLNQKYAPGHSNDRPTLTKPNLITCLNLIIEWDYVKLPEDHEPLLQPGDVFTYGSSKQIIAVDSDETLVLILSETGPLALERLWADHWEPELNFLDAPSLGGDPEVSWNAVSEVPSGATETFTLDYGLYRAFKERLITGRGFINDWTIEVTYKNPKAWVIEPKSFYLTKIGIKYNPNEIEDDLKEYFFFQSLREIWDDTERILPPEPEEKKEEEDLQEAQP